EPRKVIVYDINTNHWSQLGVPAWFLAWTGNVHAYQLQTIDPTRQLYFRILANTYDVHQCSIDNDNLTLLFGSACPGTASSPSPSGSGTTARAGIEYFPDRDSLVFNGQGPIWEKRPVGSGEWRSLGLFPDLTRDGIMMAYSAQQHALVFGGGADAGGNNLKWFKMDASGTILQIDDRAFAAANHFSLFANDPISGKFILIQPNAWPSDSSTGYDFWELDIARPAGTQWVYRSDLAARVPDMGYPGYGPHNF